MATKKPALLDREEIKPDAGMTKVKLYDCEVRLHGDIMHTLWKFGITNGEIRVLRDIHGNNSVVNITESGEKEVNEMEELYALAVKYSKDIDPRPGIARVERLFGVRLQGFDAWNELRYEQQEERRREAQQKAQAKAARYMQARLAAEARVQAEMAAEAETA